ncbi:universal stress protein [Fluviicola sp.]|uniref:universal stress protein n=1 Tax=Fluviicola sp. TaxID=1917219 RepID=UPI0026390800|nr:universal stress protein [Fluviicola sp.]
MKKILVPTDFSKLSDNALDYAVQLAKKTETELVLLHAYPIPVFVENSILTTTEQYLKKEALDNLEKLKKSIEKSNSDLKISYTTIGGNPVDVISSYAKKQYVDLIVIGAQGTGYLQEKILGSTASTLIRKTTIPIMIIDKQVRFRVPKKIVLAVDFTETDDSLVLKPLKELASTFKSHICILNVFTEAQIIPTFGEIAESFRIEKSLKQTYHTFFEVEHPDIVNGINDFVKKHDIDLVTMISRKHSLIGRLFREPLTKAMSFHNLTPLLILHE